MEFKNGLPVEPRKICGVYRFVFGDGSFYIGCSKDLRKRYAKWVSDFKTKRWLSVSISERLSINSFVEMEVVELCPELELKQREAFHLMKHSGDPMLLSRSDYAWAPVIQYDSSGRFVKRHASIGSAARYNSFKLGKVQMVLNGQRVAHKGMVFVYESKGVTGSFVKNKVPKKNKSVKINQREPGGNVVATYVTLTEAEKKVGCSRRNIQRVLSGEQNTAAGFVWEYAS